MNTKNKEAKIVVTGVKGQLGYDVVKELKNRGYINVLGIDINDLDITKEEDVINFFTIHKPDIIMHNAAYTSVDKAEENADLCYKINALGTKYLANEAKKYNAKFVYISTDYVFKGDGTKFYEVDDKKEGLSVYGRTKSEGEEFVKEILSKYFIVRISWVFGKNGKNFVKNMLNLGKNSENELNIVNDQIGSPTYTFDLAKLLCDMIETEKYGVYHATNEGICSWYDFAKEIFRLSNSNVKVNGVSTEKYMILVKNQAKRPLNSRMSKKSLVENGFNLLPTWQDALKRYIKELEEDEKHV